MSSVPRIVVVDDTYAVARMVRGAMVLLHRPHILIEVPGAEDALEEIARGSTQLVVTACRLPGPLDGFDLAARISRASLGTPVIVLAEEGDPVLDHKTLEEAPYQYFMRPVAEPFLRGLRIALDGEAAVQAQESPARPELDLGPVPTVNPNSLRDILGSLMRDVGAMAVILADRTGRILLEQGATGYIDREKLAVILGPSFARAADVSALVGGNAWTMQYYDGERLDVFGLSLGVHYFMCLIFEGSTRSVFGAVTVYGRRAADQMIDLIGEAAYLTRKPESLPIPPARQEEPPPPAEESARKKKRKTTETEPVAAQKSAPPAPAEQPIRDLDFEKLFAQQVDENAADLQFDPNNLSDMAASLFSDDGERVGYDEAIDLGILDDN